MSDATTVNTATHTDAPLAISVITAVYNNAATLPQTLSSLHTQTWPRIEHLIIDGGSTDGSLEILKQKQAQPTVLLSEPDLGVYDALNKGIARASGDVIGFLHADDVYGYDEALADIARAFADPGVMAVYGDLEYVSQSNVSRVVRKWKSGTYSRGKLAWGWMPPHPTFYLRRHPRGGFRCVVLEEPEQAGAGSFVAKPWPVRYCWRRSRWSGGSHG